MYDFGAILNFCASIPFYRFAKKIAICFSFLSSVGVLFMLASGKGRCQSFPVDGVQDTAVPFMDTCVGRQHLAGQKG